MSYQEVAEHPLVGLDAGSALQRWIETSLGPLAPVVRHRTVVADLNALVALAAAGVGLAVVPRLAVDPGGQWEICALQDAWARRHLSLCRGSTVRSSPETAAALAEHIRRCARDRRS